MREYYLCFTGKEIKGKKLIIKIIKSFSSLSG
jgi:hypothetical protein